MSIFAPPIEIRIFQKKYLASVVRLYNKLVGAILCNWPETEDEFSDVVLGNGKLSNPDLPFFPDNFLIAEIAGTEVGFLHFAVLEKDLGLIHCLTLPNG